MDNLARTSTQVRYCHFCCMSENAVPKLFSSAGVSICKDCVDLLHDMMHEDEPGDPPLP